MMMPVLFAVVLLLAPGIFMKIEEGYPINLLVMNSVENTKNLTFSTHVAYRGILLGALKNIETMNADFKFTYNETNDYGPYLWSVNGVAQNTEKQTYWQLLVNTIDGKIIIPDVGIGCYIPKPHEQVILKYTKW